MDQNDLANRFEYHPPRDEATIRAHEAIRALSGDLAFIADDILPEGREKSTAITKLEEFMFWANASIARAKR